MQQPGSSVNGLAGAQRAVRSGTDDGDAQLHLFMQLANFTPTVPDALTQYWLRKVIYFAALL